MGGKNNCCRCVPPPDILIEGMTGGEWVPSLAHPCCWERTYTYDEPQDWILKSDEIIRELRSESTSVVEYFEFRKDPIPLYRVSSSSYGGPEECPTLPSYPFFDCGTWVKAATRTIEILDFAKDRHRYWTKQKDLVIRYSHSIVTCDEDPTVKRFIFQVQQNFWWSFLRQQNYGGGFFGLGSNHGVRSTFSLEPCFGWRYPGTPAAGWNEDTYPPTEDTPWLPPITDPDDAIITSDFVIKTKVYNEIPETDVWAFDDPHTLECWTFCANFDQMIRPTSCIQEAEALTTCDCTISEAQYNIAPTGPGINPFYTCWYCPDETGVGSTYTVLPAILPDCSSNLFLIDILTVSCDGSLAGAGFGLATYNPLFSKPNLFDYICGPACEPLTCASTAFGWHIPDNRVEKCAYPLSSSSATLESQLSFSLDIICNEQKLDVCHNFITLTLDFNL